MDAEDGTVPLDETFTEIVEYHGRSYQQYALTNGTYFVPIDEDEIARLELMHGVLNSVFDNRLIFPPVRSPRRILDCGCGSGEWAVDVATQNPNAEVLGIDVSPHMIPENPPDNLELQVDDLNGRPCVIEMVKAVSTKRTALQGPSGTVAAGELDEERGLHRDRIKTVDATDLLGRIFPFTSSLAGNHVDDDFEIQNSSGVVGHNGLPRRRPGDVGIGRIETKRRYAQHSNAGHVRRLSCQGGESTSLGLVFDEDEVERRFRPLGGTQVAPSAEKGKKSVGPLAGIDWPWTPRYRQDGTSDVAAGDWENAVPLNSPSELWDSPLMSSRKGKGGKGKRYLDTGTLHQVRHPSLSSAAKIWDPE
ncbi:hypothetical protein G7Z17_g6964 [Cylindrodendrum hubeiense]|uniref:Methyltransferase domain-containing protein n=1 Tax=Cylindrodendrum hubeiense TaxID=595255 RepID=A0A9P5H9Y4_9HYPO|nr:hypothetical protein G7Z17_g6964 [Cylindrodendrum hubeiense]